MFTILNYSRRVVLACIKCLGRHPCPNCDVLMKDIWKMGRPPMGEDRIEQIRHDTAFVQQRLTKARKLIFEGKASIGSKKIEDELQFASLIPARVSFFILLKCHGRSNK